MSTPIDTATAIENSQKSQNGCVYALVEMDVRGSASVKGRDFLNSIEDYRDPRSLNVRVEKNVVKAVKSETGLSPKDHFLGSCILVKGNVCQTKIRVRDTEINGKMIKRGYYFQTQLSLRSTKNIQFCELSTS
ncbi:hypothetical protein [Litorimonas taeanensis]|uniref:hypothetical protein n=1 Tax=Litorimonas taeanensis TaxID=568099 RepID=UPI0011C34DB2|nr:hypothetical protein [Litorimonas taeanensis]